MRRWMPAALILAGLAALVGYTLGDVLDPGNGRLPGRDSGNGYVWELFTRSTLSQSLLPHWNPYLFAGAPHLADPQTNVFYPPAMLLRWLPLPLFFGWMMALHLWLMGAGTLFLCRAIGLGWTAGAAAAAAVTLGGAVGTSLYEGHLLLIYSTAWYPWALAFAVSRCGEAAFFLTRGSSWCWRCSFSQDTCKAACTSWARSVSTTRTASRGPKTACAVPAGCFRSASSRWPASLRSA